MKIPLVVLLIRLGNPADTEAYASGLRDAFVANESGQTGPRELLQAAEFREFVLPAENPESILTTFGFDFLGPAERILVFVIDASSMEVPTTNKLSNFERALLQKLDLFPNPTKIVGEVFLKYSDGLFDSAPSDPRLVRFGMKELNERDLRLPFLILYALHQALRLFSPHLGDNATSKHVRLFFSHAKRDGVPLTTVALDWMMKRLAGFNAFYDTNDLDLDGDIDSQLNVAVKCAVVIVFRSDIFDQRYWCQREVLWAELHGRPVITVDARWQIEYRPSVISFDSTPVVRIPDGNVVRIFASALTEALRIELFNGRVAIHAANLSSSSYTAVPRFPSLVSINEACKALRNSATTSPGVKTFIVYPNPSLPALLLEASENLSQSSVKGCEVVSLDEFRLRR
jgi:hypothetical protein